MSSSDLAWFLRRVALFHSPALAVVAVAFLVQGQTVSGVTLGIVAALACVAGWGVRGKEARPGGARPWRYRGIRSERARRATKAVFVAAGLSALLLVGVLRARGDEDGDRNTVVVAVVAIAWAGGVALRFRAFARRLDEEEQRP
jgi:hypothetical protein